MTEVDAAYFVCPEKVGVAVRLSDMFGKSSCCDRIGTMTAQPRSAELCGAKCLSAARADEAVLKKSGARLDRPEMEKTQ